MLDQKSVSTLNINKMYPGRKIHDLELSLSDALKCTRPICIHNRKDVIRQAKIKT